MNQLLRYAAMLMFVAFGAALAVYIAVESSPPKNKAGGLRTPVAKKLVVQVRTEIPAVGEAPAPSEASLELPIAETVDASSEPTEATVDEATLELEATPIEDSSPTPVAETASHEMEAAQTATSVVEAETTETEVEPETTLSLIAPAAPRALPDLRAISTQRRGPPAQLVSQSKSVEATLRELKAPGSGAEGEDSEKDVSFPAPPPLEEIERQQSALEPTEQDEEDEQQSGETLPRSIAEEVDAVPPKATPRSAEALPPPVASARISRSVSPEGDDSLSIYIQDKDIREVLAALSEQGGLNILPSKSVTGTVSASLNNVDIDTALDAILRSTGYSSRREGNMIYVGTSQDFSDLEHALDTIGTRIYRPNYAPVLELKKLISPLLTEGVGVIESTSPSKTKIPADSTDAEGDGFAGSDALLVRDYEAILAQVDQIVAEVDSKPIQVAIEAMILSVKLDDMNECGVDFNFLRQQGNVRFGTGQPLNEVAELSFQEGGMKFGFLDSNLGAFLKAVETIGDTNVVATPRLMVLNKHRAEIQIGAELGYVSTTVTETSSSQNVEFLEVGAQLRLRPFVAQDGSIRMEIHPELSTGTVRVEGGFTLPDKEVTQVTTNIMVQDGSTVIIGGLMREDLVKTKTQVPLLGSIPLVGALFSSKREQLERREILVLVTPRIVCDEEAAHEGEQGAKEFHRRQAVFADKMSPFGKRHIARRYFRMAQEAWKAGDRKAALRYVELSIDVDPQNRAAIDLRSHIWSHDYPSPGIKTTSYEEGGSYTVPSDEELILEEQMLGQETTRPSLGKHETGSSARRSADASTLKLRMQR